MGIFLPFFEPDGPGSQLMLFSSPLAFSSRAYFFESFHCNSERRLTSHAQGCSLRSSPYPFARVSLREACFISILSGLSVASLQFCTIFDVGAPGDFSARSFGPDVAFPCQRFFLLVTSVPRLRQPLLWLPPSRLVF